MLLTLLCLAAAAALGTAVYTVATDKSWRTFEVEIYSCLRRLGRHGTSPAKPLSATQREATQKKNTEPSLNEAFPPARRHLLPDSQARVAISDKSLEFGTTERLSASTTLTPDKETIDPKQMQDHITATGFRVDEITSLGDFPDYAQLSGVPLPETHANFDISTALPRPYRPFRWGYFQNMCTYADGIAKRRYLTTYPALSKMEPDWWLELNRDYVDTIRYRQVLFKERGPRVIQTLPGAELAAKELMEMCLQFLCARYPQLFRLDLKNMLFHNNILETTTDLKSSPAMHVLLNNIPEDLAMMLRDPETGFYSFRGGIIMSSLGWDLGSKIGKKLHEIHDPVPDYKEKMQFSMDRYFSKMPTDKPIQRGSWGLEVDKPMYLPADQIDHSHGEQDPNLTIDRVHLRVDWQTLRRLPLSGAIVFNFKCLFTPVTEFRDEPYIPSLLLKVLRDGKENLMEYKGHQTDHVTIPVLEQYEREQIEKGMIEQDWEPHTLDGSPFFPGWREKWQRQQGF